MRLDLGRVDVGDVDCLGALVVSADCALRGDLEDLGVQPLADAELVQVGVSVGRLAGLDTRGLGDGVVREHRAHHLLIRAVIVDVGAPDRGAVRLVRHHVLAQVERDRLGASERAATLGTALLVDDVR